MGSPAFAFSVHNFISSVGADAGFAAIIGLAILVLLYFAHARETANLRDEAALLAERLQQAEARVAELSRPQPVSDPVPAAEAVQVRDQRGAIVSAPFAPAGLGAPPLASATRVVPLVEPPADAQEEPAEEAGPAVMLAAASVAAASPASATSPSPAAAPATSPPATSPPPTSRPVAPRPTAAPLPSAAAAPGVPRPATPAGAANGGGRGPVPLMPGAPPSSRARSPELPRQLPPLPSSASRDGSVLGRVVLGLVALLLVAGVAVALVVLTGGSSSSSSKSSNQTPTTNAPSAHRTAAFSPSAVTVAVLNGTATNQLAHRVAAKLGGQGYKEGRIATAANQTLSTTIVAYLPGASNRTDALHVANALHLRPTAVQPIDQGTQQVACPPPGACDANVVVTVGADLATL